MSESKKVDSSDQAETVRGDQIESEYGVAQMRYLSDLEHVRERTGMYVGSSDLNGLHHLVTEVVDNSIDEVGAGQASQIQVAISEDGSISIEDDGRGIPVEFDANIQCTALEGVMTKLKYGAKFNDTSGNNPYKTPGGLHGIGVKAVNFLSEWCAVEVRRNGHVYRQTYQRGRPESDVSKIGTAATTGTKTTFRPDSKVFGELQFDYELLRRRIQERAFLNRGVKIALEDQRTGESETFQYDQGLVEFVKHLNRATEAVHPEVVCFTTHDTEKSITVEVALQYNTDFQETVRCYVNNINTEEGGTHLKGFRAALTRTLTHYGKRQNLFKGVVPCGEDFREGLAAVVSVKLPNPNFESQTKVRLNNAEVEGIVNASVGDYLMRYFEENPKTARELIRKSITAAEMRETARRQKELSRMTKSVSGVGGLPGKLRDCISNDVKKTELYLVEGDSAGGSAEGGRLKEYQAILPLRGKIINAYKSREDKVLANEEVQSIIAAVGCGIGSEQKVGERRYGKIIIMTDADVDGSHIRTLLLCFFYRQMYELVAAGHIYIAQPPLFRVRDRKSVHYVQSESAMHDQLLRRGIEGAELDAGGGRVIRGEAMGTFCLSLARMEKELVAMERKGVTLSSHAERMDLASGRLPTIRAVVNQQIHWFATRSELDAFLHQAAIKEGVASPPQDESNDGDAPQGRPGVLVTEFREIQAINEGLASLTGLGLDVQVLLPQQRTGVNEPRFVLRLGEQEIPLEELRSLPAVVRGAGEKGLQVTRFKGLGEMNADELRETTLDPANRTLVQVTLNNAGAADEMFLVLMGERVEPRREFIEKHALEVRNLDV